MQDRKYNGGLQIEVGQFLPRQKMISLLIECDDGADIAAEKWSVSRSKKHKYFNDQSQTIAINRDTFFK